MIRPARRTDIDALVALEIASFRGDRITSRSFERLIAAGSSVVLADVEKGALCGYVLLFFRTRSRVARLYSIAVAAEARGRGIGRRLVRAAEREVRKRRRTVLRLECRKDNATSIALFRGLGYRPFGTIEDYYEDGMAAIRFEKTLARP